MVDYGVIDTGFSAKTQQIVLSEIETDQLAEISPILDVSADQPNGQNNGILSRALALLWELAEVAYNSFDPDRAEGAQLESVCKLTGTYRLAATYSTTPCTLGLVAGTTLISGTHFASVDGDPNRRFTPIADFTAPSTGGFAVIFRAENTGPVQAPSTSLVIIATPVVGWDSVTNTADATLGTDIESDISLRLRRAEDVARSGSSTIDAMRDDILALRQTTVPELETVTMFENTTSFIDNNGLPPHSFMALVWDGDTPNPANNDHIAQAIWDGKPAGIQSFGSQSGNAIDKIGATQIVTFGRAQGVPIYLIFQLSTNALYVGNTQFQIAIAQAANDFFNAVASTVIAERLKALALQIAGVLDVLSLKLGTAPAPTGTTNIAIGTFQIARFDSTRVSNI